LPEPDGARVDDRDLVLFKRIVNDGEILGTVYLRADYELFSRVFDYLGLAAVVLIAAMLVALLMSSWMQNIVTRPILAIAQIAREVVGQRDYSRRAAKMSADEVGTLVDSFNDMLAEIDRRTRELEASNAKLAQEAEERSRAEREVLRLNVELEDHVCHCAEAFLSVVDLIPEVDVEVAATLERVSGTASQSNIQASKAIAAKPRKDGGYPKCWINTPPKLVLAAAPMPTMVASDPQPN